MNISFTNHEGDRLSDNSFSGSFPGQIFNIPNQFEVTIF